MNKFYSLYQGILFYVCIFDCVCYEVDFVKSRFVISRFFFHTFYCKFSPAEEDCSLYRGLCYIEVH